jgi:hypothetical protein
MMPIIIDVLLAMPLAQRLPGMGSDPLSKGVNVPFVSKRVDPPAVGDRVAAGNEKALAGLNKLIEEASALRASLLKSPAETISATDFKRMAKMKNALKSVEEGLKGKR